MDSHQDGKPGENAHADVTVTSSTGDERRKGRKTHMCAATNGTARGGAGQGSPTGAARADGKHWPSYFQVALMPSVCLLLTTQITAPNPVTTFSNTGSVTRIRARR